MSESGDAIDRFLEQEIGLPLSVLTSAPEEIIQKLAHRRSDRRDWMSATEDFVTYVLQTDLISDREDYLRLEILRCLQFMSEFHLHHAMHGSDEEFRNLDPKQERYPAYLILDYLRRTRGRASITSQARERFLGYPSSPPAEHRECFEQLVVAFREFVSEQGRRPVPRK